MSLRNVRLIFDWRERPESNLVVGEVVNYPGRWSSYPPHHHAQPELYHYRFTEPQGYGHAELGERVFKVRQNDTIKIMGGESHSQVSAPGYGMYYLWIIRHLEGRPYRGFEFLPEHRWLLSPDEQGWRPRDGEG
jgi:5-deoxy-glucuronate isomerase